MASAASAAIAAYCKSGEAIMARRLHLADETPLDRSLAQLRTARGPHGIERVRRGQWSPVGDQVWSPKSFGDLARPKSRCWRREPVEALAWVGRASTGGHQQRVPEAPLL